MHEYLMAESRANARVFNPGSLLFSVIEELQALIDKYKIEIECELKGLQGDVIGFDGIVRLIVTDILVVLMNAMEGRKVDVFLGRIDCDPDTLVFMAGDRCTVIAAEKEVELFFGESHPNLIRARTLLKCIGGSLKIRSLEEFGTTLIMTMPVQLMEEEEDAASDYLLSKKNRNEDLDLGSMVPQIFKPKEILFSIVDEFKSVIERKRIHLDYTIEERHQSVITYPDLFRQIIRDLLKVLIDGISQGVLTICLESKLSDQANVLLMIESTDWTLPDEASSNFVLTAQEQKNVERVQYLVDQLHGTFDFDKDPDLGVAFTVTIPAIYPLLLECIEAI